MRNKGFVLICVLFAELIISYLIPLFGVDVNHISSVLEAILLAFFGIPVATVLIWIGKDPKTKTIFRFFCFCISVVLGVAIISSIIRIIL